MWFCHFLGNSSFLKPPIQSIFIYIIMIKAEKSTLSEALRENELEVLRLRGIVQEKDGKLVKADEQTSLMVRRAEQRSQVEFTDR